MKIKILAVIFCVLFVISIALNVHFFRTNQSLNQSITESQSQIDALTTMISEKDTTLTDANNQLLDLKSTVSDLQSQFDVLQTRIDNTKVVDGYTVESIDPTKMYVSEKKGAPVRRGASDDYISDSTLSYGQAITVVGKVNYQSKTWYQLSPQSDVSKGVEMVSASLLSTNAPKVQESKVQIPSKPTIPSNTATSAQAPSSGGILGGGTGGGFFSGGIGTGDGTGAGDWGEAE